MRNRSLYILLLSLFLLTPWPARAEGSLTLSLVGGPLRSWMAYEDFWDDVWDRQDAETGFTVGGLVRFGLGTSAQLETGLRYVRLENQIHLRDDLLEAGSFENRFEYLTVPFALRLYPGTQRSFFIGGGIEIGTRVNAESTNDTTLDQSTVDLDDDLELLHFSYVAMAGVEIPLFGRGINLMGRYAHGAGGVIEPDRFITDWNTRELAVLLEIPLLQLP